MLTTQIQTLFNNFKEGFKTLDLNKISKCYHLPCTLNTPESLCVVNTEFNLNSEIKGIFEQLKNEGFSYVNLSNTSYCILNNEICFVSIDWQFVDKHHDVFSEFSAFYHLMIIDKQLKIFNATSHQINNSQQLTTPFFLND